RNGADLLEADGNRGWVYRGDADAGVRTGSNEGHGGLALLQATEVGSDRKIRIVDSVPKSRFGADAHTGGRGGLVNQGKVLGAILKGNRNCICKQPLAYGVLFIGRDDPDDTCKQ